MCYSGNVSSDGKIVIESEQDRERRSQYEKSYSMPTPMTPTEARNAGYVVVDPMKHIPPRKIRHDA